MTDYPRMTEASANFSHYTPPMQQPDSYRGEAADLTTRPTPEERQQRMAEPARSSDTDMTRPPRAENTHADPEPRASILGDTVKVSASTEQPADPKAAAEEPGTSSGAHEEDAGQAPPTDTGGNVPPGNKPPKPPGGSDEAPSPDEPENGGDGPAGYDEAAFAEEVGLIVSRTPLQLPPERYFTSREGTPPSKGESSLSLTRKDLLAALRIAEASRNASGKGATSMSGGAHEDTTGQAPPTEPPAGESEAPLQPGKPEGGVAHFDFGRFLTRDGYEYTSADSKVAEHVKTLLAKIFSEGVPPEVTGATVVPHTEHPGTTPIINTPNTFPADLRAPATPEGEAAEHAAEGNAPTATEATFTPYDPSDSPNYRDPLREIPTHAEVAKNIAPSEAGDTALTGTPPEAAANGQEQPVDYAKPIIPKDLYAPALYSRYGLPEAPSLEQIRPVAEAIVAFDALGAFELVMGQGLSAKEVLAEYPGFMRTLAGLATPGEKFDFLVRQKNRTKVLPGAAPAGAVEQPRNENEANPTE